MNPFDENSQPDPESPAPEAPLPANTTIAPSALPESRTVPGDPIDLASHHGPLPTLTAPAPPARPVPDSYRNLPEDIRVSWSWPHFILFVLFGFFSLIVIQAVVVIPMAAGKRLTTEQMQNMVMDHPVIAVGMNVLWFAGILLFLYVTLAVLRDMPFWESLGWRKLLPKPNVSANPWMYLFSGCALAIVIALVSSRLHTPDNLPIQEMFKSRTGALLMMGMAVLLAPLIEETVFRGYLYPLFAKSFGVGASIMITGILFGMMHGAQLGWTWSMVSLLSLVGIILTYVRARTGTVLASFLLHLGYNSMIAISSIIATRGFTHIPKF